MYAKMDYKISKSAHVDIIKAAFYLGSAYDMTNDYENSVKFNLEALQNAQKLNDKTIFQIFWSLLDTITYNEQSGKGSWILHQSVGIKC